MKYIFSTIALLTAICGFGADPAEKPIEGTLEAVDAFRKPKSEIRMVVPGYLWVEAEDFDSYGDWKLDTQFVHKMGSGYLLAAGICEPITDASTKIDIPKAGTYRVWARTLDWLPEFSPGKFAVAVNGKQGKKIRNRSRVSIAG